MDGSSGSNVYLHRYWGVVISMFDYQRVCVVSGPVTSKNQIGGNMSGESMVKLLDVTSQQPGLE